MLLIFQECVSYSLLGTGWVLLTSLMYFITLEQLSELPTELIIVIVGLALLLELVLHPIASSFKKFRRILGPKQFLWMLRVGAAFLIVVWSTQSYVASFILVIIICIVIERLQRPRRSKRQRPRS